MARKNANGKTRKAAESNGPTADGRDSKGRFAHGNKWGWPAGTSGNPKGRPTTHDELREFIQHSAAEGIGLGDHPEWPRLYVMLRSMMSSKNAADHTAVLEHGYGKVTQPFKWEDDLVAWLRDNAETLRTDAAERARVARILAEGGHDAAALFAGIGLSVVVSEDVPANAD